MFCSIAAAESSFRELIYCTIKAKKAISQKRPLSLYVPPSVPLPLYLLTLTLLLFPSSSSDCVGSASTLILTWSVFGVLLPIKLGIKDKIINWGSSTSGIYFLNSFQNKATAVGKNSELFLI